MEIDKNMDADDIKKLIAYRHEGHTWSECALQFNLNWAASAQIQYMKHTDINDRITVKRKRSPNGSNAAMAAKVALAERRALATPSEVKKPHTYKSNEATSEEAALQPRVEYCTEHIECIDQFRHKAKCPFVKA
jgi:hypothetical protein